jgi:hypothetical protein
MQSNESVSHRLVDEDISGSGCTWKKHHGTLTTRDWRSPLLDHQQGLGLKGTKISCVVADPKDPPNPKSWAAAHRVG